MDNTVGSQQHAIICGTLLGDSVLERNGKYVRLVADHSANQSQYVEWKASILADFTTTITQKSRFDQRTNQTYHHCILRTRTSPKLEYYYQLFYQKGRKVVTPTLPRIIVPQMLAVWLMDDGYHRNDCQALRINTQSYPIAEQLLIKQALANLNIEANIQRHQSSFVVYIPSKSMPRLRAIVKPYVIDSMAYKIA